MEMKSGWKMMSVLALVLLFAFVAACSQKKDETQSQQQAPAQEEQVAQDQAVAQEEQEAEPTEESADQTAEAEESQDQMVEISGTLVQTEDGVGLFSDSGNYLLDQDLSDMVGQNVRVTGILEEIDGKPVFTVSSISIVE
jgi:glucose/arabinose dehydrogenase